LFRSLFITQDYAPDLGGMARRHVELCRRLPIDQVVVSTVKASDGGAFDRGERYPIDRQPFTFVQAKTFASQMRWARAIVPRLRAGLVDVIHLGNIRPCGYAVELASLQRRVPCLVYVNGGDLLHEKIKTASSRAKRWSARRILGGAGGIVANSAWTADLARDVMLDVGVTRLPPIAAIDLGADPAQFSPARNSGALRMRLGLGDTPLIVTIARLVPHKGQDTGIEALALLGGAFADVRYLIIGEGTDRQRLETRARELGVSDRVIFTGPLSDDEIAEAYATATVYLGLSRLEHAVQVEGFGLSFVEASASAVPVIAGDSGGTRSAVRDGETGVIVPPADAPRAAEALRALLGNPDRAAGMGAAGRRAVESHYNWDRVARETVAFTQDVLSGAAR
jgi:phosphatidylinositol alpha-1,6-mannosyltransferase